MVSSRLAWPATDAGFHQIPSLPGCAATIAWPIPTDCAPVGRRRKRAPSLPVVVACAPAPPARRLATAKLERSRLIYQHDWDIIAHCVAQPALVADENLFRFPILELRLALGTHEDLEQTLRQTHLLFSCCELIAESRQTARILPPVREHFHPQIEVNLFADEGLDLLAGGFADGA